MAGNQSRKTIGLAPGSVPLVPNVDYDYIEVTQTSTTVETYEFKSGGTGGTVVLTIVVTYTSASKKDLDKVEYS